MKRKKKEKRLLISLLVSIKDFFSYSFFFLINFKDWFNWLFYIPIASSIILQLILDFRKGLILLSIYIGSIPLTFFVIYIFFVLPGFLLSFRLGVIPKNIDELFKDFDKLKLHDENRIKVLKIKIDKKEIPENEKIDYWLYVLKCYKQHLSIIVPSTFLLIGTALSILIDYYGVEIPIERITLFLNLDSFYKDFYLKVIPIMWVLYVYLRDLQETSERIFKIELLKDLKKI